MSQSCDPHPPLVGSGRIDAVRIERVHLGWPWSSPGSEGLGVEKTRECYPTSPRWWRRSDRQPRSGCRSGKIPSAASECSHRAPYARLYT